MKNYDERIESIFRKYDARLDEKKRRNSIIRRAAASAGVCAAAIGVVWFVSGDSFKNAMKPNFPDNIIMEETEPSAKTTAPAKPVTTNAVTTPKIETSTAVATKTSDVSSVSINTAPINSTAAKRPDTTAPSPNKLTTAVQTNVVTDIPTETTAITNVVAAVITTTQISPMISPVRPPMPESAEETYFYRFTDDETDIQYTMLILSVPSDIIDSFIKTVRLTEETQADSSVISCNADIFTIEGISREAMIALRYEEDDTYICYRNRNYKVNTFGELADSFAFNKCVSFKSAENFNGDKIYGFDEEAVKKLLSENSDARAVDLYSLPLDEVYMEIILTCEFADNKSFLFGLGISQNGYLTTNLTGREMAFYIGEDTADELIKLIETDSSHQ